MLTQELCVSIAHVSCSGSQVQTLMGVLTSWTSLTASLVVLLSLRLVWHEMGDSVVCGTALVVLFGYQSACQAQFHVVQE